MNGYFFTGFPGFICQQLVHELLETRKDIHHLFLLVLPTQKNISASLIQKLKSAYPNTSFHLIEGDITKQNLNLNNEDHLLIRENVQYVFHLAAIYDLAVKKEIATHVNVNGTQQVVNLLPSLPYLKRFVYFSTAYVAGKRGGTIFERELVHQEGFKNHYEETKYLAEIIVNQAKNNLPVTIIRPGIVKGHSLTGATIKFDGPYLMLNFLDHLRFLPVIPHLGKGEAEFNVVPIDYIVKSTCYLTHSEAALGKTLHLTNPHPITMREAYSVLMEKLLKRAPRGSLPLQMAKLFLQVPSARKWLRVEKEALDYFTWRGSFDCSEAQNILKDGGIVCPRFIDTAETMVKYYVEHKDDNVKHIHIS
ncbi:Linear gramicidin synthase subunit D [Bacillus sp. THAF10]|uniref:SDR family oxidoreductase n=1 Tax=Bacillus sp. THAF10 TaxID=2587848 RepID=UPI001267A4BA|nr:SDR family oxidoreductase [Bacillus sp. THAF10]QFT88494.1 Linear gramicidin synthase subunit D [Bacillus sp. THAF10]